jgi:hypothetical protein
MQILIAFHKLILTYVYYSLFYTKLIIDEIKKKH